MIPDQTTLDLAQRTPFPYSVVHEALRMLAAAGVPHEKAIELVEDCATARANPCQIARSYLQWAGPAPEPPARWWDLTIAEGLAALARLIWRRR